MGTIGEYYADGVTKCPKCGSTDLIVKNVGYLFIIRDDNLNVVKEYEGEKKDNIVCCKECKYNFG